MADGVNSNLPAPLVPAHVDLSTFPAFLFDVDRILSSETYALCNADEGWAMVNLWMRAWKQSPPGSLPDDERLLAKFSAVPAKWKKVREIALRGFVKCSDGRLYHTYLSRVANEQWERSRTYKERSKEANEAKRRKRKADLEASYKESYKEPSRSPTGNLQGTLKESLSDLTEPNRTELVSTKVQVPENSPPSGRGEFSPDSKSQEQPAKRKGGYKRVEYAEL